MIVGFKSDETRRIFDGLVSRRFPADIQNTARRKLRALDAAVTLLDLRSPPGNRLEALRGDREGQHSIRINDQWRVCFVWRDAKPENAASEAGKKRRRAAVLMLSRLPITIER